MPSSKSLKSIPQYLVVDDEIVALSDKEDFKEDTGLPLEHSIFVQTYEEALDVLTSNSNIVLCFVDLRIPKNRRDKYEEDTDRILDWQDYIKEKVINIREEYGAKLLSKIQNISTYIYSAYADLSALKGLVQSHDIVKGCFRKTGISKNIQEEIQAYLKFFPQEKSPTIVNASKSFDYSLLDEETSIFVQQRTQEIKKSTKRMKNDIIKIGRYLIQVKEKLEYGYFRAWVEAEFEWGSIRTAARFMNVAQKFTNDRLAHLDILPSALYELASRSFPKTGLTEALERAEQGEKITEKIAKEIGSRHKSLKEEISKNTENTTTKKVKKNSKKDSKKGVKVVTQLELSEAEKEEISQIPSAKIEQPKQAILKVVSTAKLTQDSWWQLGENHQLFCGQPGASIFLDKLPSNIALVVNSPPNNDFSKIPPIKSGLEISFRSKYSDITVDALANVLEDFLSKTTKPQDTVVFCYSFDLKLLQKASEMNRSCFIAEPNLEKCDRILQHWREKESVKKIIT